MKRRQRVPGPGKDDQYGDPERRVECLQAGDQGARTEDAFPDLRRDDDSPGEREGEEPLVEHPQPDARPEADGREEPAASSQPKVAKERERDGEHEHHVRAEQPRLDEEADAGGEDQRRGDPRGFAEQERAEGAGRHDRSEPGERRPEASVLGRSGEGEQRRGEPVHERWLGEERLAVHAGRHPVPRDDHLARRLGEHPFRVREAGLPEPPEEERRSDDQDGEQPPAHAPQ